MSDQEPTNKDPELAEASIREPELPQQDIKDEQDPVAADSEQLRRPLSNVSDEQKPIRSSSAIAKEGNRPIMAESKGVDGPVKSEADERREAWLTVCENLHDQDHDMIDRWKSEMDNLLIYAALYSAVITSFLVASIPLITPDDDGDMLMNISLRVASYSISNGFANATQLSDPTPPGPLPKYAVTVNKLWLLSLTFSVMATFFAITIQQWLRFIQVPKHLRLRDAVRLRQNRYEALIKWQVPYIIPVLPALVQISVVLFLVGLLQYIRHIDKGVALPFTVVSSICFVSFVIVSFIPIIDPSCPYKSPLLDVLWKPLLFLLSLVMELWWLFDIDEDGKMGSQLKKFRSFVLESMAKTTIGERIARERRRAQQQHPKGSLEQRALTFALTPKTTVKALKPCLKDLDPFYRTRCVLDWISIQYGDSDSPDAEGLFPEGTLKKDILECTDLSFANLYGALLLDVLKEDWDDKANSRGKDTDIPHIVTLLWNLCIKNDIDIKYGDTSLRSAFIQELFKLCLDWGTDVWWMRSHSGWEPSLRIPAVLLFYSWEQIEGDMMDGLNSLNVVEYANNVIEITNKIVQDIILLQPSHQSTSRWIAAEEHVFSITANTLKIVLAVHGSTDNQRTLFQVSSLLQSLYTFIEKARPQIKETVRDWVVLKDSEWLPFVTRKAIASICLSIEKLWRGGKLTSDLKPEGLVGLLVEICSARGDAELADFRDKLQQLLDEEDEKRSAREQIRPDIRGSAPEGSRISSGEIPKLSKLQSEGGASEDNESEPK